MSVPDDFECDCGGTEFKHKGRDKKRRYGLCDKFKCQDCGKINRLPLA